MKAQTRVDGPWSNDTDSWIDPKYKITDEQLYPWQRQMIDMVTIPNDRYVDFIYCPVGNKGKSFLTFYLTQNNRAIAIPPVNDAKDLIQSTCDILIAKETRDPKLLILDAPRCMKQYKMNGIYQAIETLKNGWAYDFRHHFKQYFFLSPRIIVFSNEKPYLKSLSPDRWKVWTFQEDHITCELSIVPYNPLKRKEPEPIELD